MERLSVLALAVQMVDAAARFAARLISTVARAIAVTVAPAARLARNVFKVVMEVRAAARVSSAVTASVARPDAANAVARMRKGNARAGPVAARTPRLARI
jgi:hypothetical protein